MKDRTRRAMEVAATLPPVAERRSLPRRLEKLDRPAAMPALARSGRLGRLLGARPPHPAG